MAATMRSGGGTPTIKMSRWSSSSSSNCSAAVLLSAIALLPLLLPDGASALALSMSTAPASSKSSVHTISVERAFTSLVRNPTFRTDTWQKRALLMPPATGTDGSNTIQGHFTIDDLADCVTEQFVVAGRGTFTEGRGGWNMARVGTKKPTANLEASKLTFPDLQKALEEKSGTVVVNSAGSYAPSLAKVCEECLNAFGLPVNMNLYVTAFGQQTSAPPHTDKQDVFVIQTQGRKRWRVYEPSDVTKSQTDPMERGKGSDLLSLEKLGEPVVDGVLEEGGILYIPAGWPHTTDTVNVAPDDEEEDSDNAAKEKEPSIHMTVGVDTHIWGLTYASLRQYCLAKSERQDALKSPLLHTTVSDSEHYWRLQDTLPLGFLADGTALASSREALAEEVCTNLVCRMRAAEPGLYKDATPEAMRADLKVDEVLTKLISHHGRMMDVFGNLYADVAYELEDVGASNFGYLRSQPYFGALEATMEDLVQWGAPPKEEKTAAKKSGFGGGGGMGGGGGAKKKKKKRGKK